MTGTSLAAAMSAAASVASCGVIGRSASDITPGSFSAALSASSSQLRWYRHFLEVELEFLTDSWMPVGVKKIVRHVSGPKWEWKATDLNPYAGTSNPFGPLRAAEERGDIFMAQRKVADWHYELVVKARQK